jgi:hypothetical protein
MKRPLAILILLAVFCSPARATQSAPDDGPTFHSDFMAGGVDSRLTFTRASSAWYFNSSGELTQASANVPRFDYIPATLALNGLLIEQQSTNLFLNSQAPATQGITVTATPYTVSFYGTGSIALTALIPAH